MVNGTERGQTEAISSEMSEEEQRRELEDAFPGLQGTTYTITSKPTESYNCIAHAAGDNQRPWWPESSGYWPPATMRAETLQAFISAFNACGYYQETKSVELESRVEKVAIFTKKGRPTHAARQLPDGSWSSKLGKDLDLSHDLRAIEGGLYGQVACILKRPAVSEPTDAGG